MELYKYQKQAANAAYLHGNSHMLLCECGTGKGQPYGSKVMTPNGWVEIQNLKTGDSVINSDGQLSMVTGVYPKEEIDTYRFHYSDGSSAVFDIDHLHICRTYNDRTRRKVQKSFSRVNYDIIKDTGNWRVMSTKQLLDSKIRYGKLNKSRKYDIPLVKPICFSKKETKIDAYLLGLLLGDEHIKTCVNFSTNDIDIINDIAKIIGDKYVIKQSYSRPCDWSITYNKHGKNPIIDALRELGLFGLGSSEKFIPTSYLYSSIEDRVKILRGLMDADGYINDYGYCEYYSTSIRLANDVVFILRSLGGNPTLRIKKTTHKDCYVACFSLKEINPFKLYRKAIKHNKNPRDNGRWIDKIEFEKKQKTICISVDSYDGSYVTENFIVTHNTTIELSIINFRLKMGYIKKCLIIAPYSILWTSWESDIKKFYPEITYEIFWHAESKSRLEMISSFNKQVAIINYEVVKKYYHKIMDLQFDMIVLDESTRIKNHASWTTKNILSLGYTIKYKSIMTATPGHIPEHYWAQLSFIDVVNESFSRFRDTFCSKVELGDTGMSKYVPRQEMFETLRNIISSKAVRLTKKECLELPEKTFIVREVALPDKAFSLYKEMEDESVVEINNEVIMAQFPGVLAQKLRQIANGMLYSHETGSRHRIHDAKLKEVDDIIDRVDGQVIIWANFTEDITALAERYDALTFYGATIDKRQSHEDFVSGKKKVIVCHPMSAGHGITWVNCNVVVYYSLPPLEHFLQSQDRVHRIGQRNPCTYYIINANSTVDKTIWNCLQKNQDYQNELINFARSILKSYNTVKGDKLCCSDEVMV